MGRTATFVRLMIPVTLLSLGSAQAGAAVQAGQNAASAPTGEVLLLDQLVVKGALPQEVGAELGPAHTMQAVIDIFDRHGVDFERTYITVPTKDLPPAFAAELNKLPPGEPFVIPVSDNSTVTVTTVNVIIDHLPADQVYTR